jgi:hypothetical protein
MEYVQQVDAEYEHYQANEQAQDEGRCRVQRKRRAKSTNNATENKERRETTYVE